VIEEFLPSYPELGRNLRKPDRGLDRLDLTEERAYAFEWVVTPMVEEAGRLGSDLPLVRVRQLSPVVDVAADLIDDRRRVVFLLRRAEAIGVPEDHFGLAA